jgi:hypothetical protein
VVAGIVCGVGGRGEGENCVVAAAAACCLLAASNLPSSCAAAAPACPSPPAGLHEEYERAAQWVRTAMPLNASFDASVFETIIRGVGGMLAAHDLTGDPVMLQRWVMLVCGRGVGGV